MSGPYHINKYPIERQDGVDLARLASVKMDALLAAAERVCWFDWSGNDPDAVAAIEELRRVVGESPK